jgi:hypothetical protein
LTRLEQLYANGGCGVNQTGLQNVTTLLKLDAGNNPKITSINHMTKLQRLDASDGCGIDQAGIKDVITLLELDVSRNVKITSINHMTKLQKLKATEFYDSLNFHRYVCGINQEGLKDVTWLLKLNANNNPKITSINHMTKLQKLDAEGECGIDQEGLKDVTWLLELKASQNNKITAINHMTQIQKLDASYNCGIDQDGIKDVTTLVVLFAASNSKIISVNHMVNLQKLDASCYFDVTQHTFHNRHGIWRNCGITQDGVKDLTTILQLDVSNNSGIISVNHMIRVQYLIAIEKCGISQAGLKDVETLLSLWSYGNKKINNIPQLKHQMNYQYVKIHY